MYSLWDCCVWDQILSHPIPITTASRSPSFKQTFSLRTARCTDRRFCDSFSTTADEDSFGLYYNRNGAGDNYDTIVLKTASARSRAQIIKGIQNICTIAPAAGASHIFIDDSYYGLWGSGNDGDTAAHYALPCAVDAIPRCLPSIRIARDSQHCDATV